jgi:GNAT superfamily N-acetyltransferase
MTPQSSAGRALSYRSAYDEQLRTRPDPPAPGETIERAGPVIRRSGGPQGGFIGYPSLAGLDGAALDAFIQAQRDHFAGLGQAAEWKYHGHDLPADLPQRLTAAGFTAEDEETVMIGEIADLAGAPVLPPGVRLREVTSGADLERIRALEETVWHDDRAWLVTMLEQELAGHGDPLAVVLAEAGPEAVCAGWVRFHEGTDFATLWGGSTLPQWRGKGIYRAMVACRAGLAGARGFRLLEVDASADSRPILARLGLLPATTTTPYVWAPSPR